MQKTKKITVLWTYRHTYSHAGLLCQGLSNKPLPPSRHFSLHIFVDFLRILIKRSSVAAKTFPIYYIHIVGPDPPPPPHQSRKDASQLDDVSVGDRVEAADPGVGDGDERRQDDGRVQVHLDDDGEGGAWMRRLR